MRAGETAPRHGEVPPMTSATVDLDSPDAGAALYDIVGAGLSAVTASFDRLHVGAMLRPHP